MHLKLALEPSVWTVASLKLASMSFDFGCRVPATECARNEHAVFVPEREEGRHDQGHSQPPTASWVTPWNTRTSAEAPSTKLGKLPSPAMSSTRGGVSVVVRARESRAQGEGRQ